jgi:hypothetical protein
MLASEVAPLQPHAVKRISSNTRISGRFGPLIDDGNDTRHRKRAHILGTVLHALDKGMYRVQFDDGTFQDVYANRLHVKSHFASLPPDIIPHRLQDDPDRPPQGDIAVDLEKEVIQENLQDSGELEHLPSETPEEDEIKQENLDGVEDNEAEQESDVHGRMPGQLDQQPVAIQPDYH